MSSRNHVEDKPLVMLSVRWAAVRALPLLLTSYSPREKGVLRRRRLGMAHRYEEMSKQDPSKTLVPVLLSCHDSIPTVRFNCTEY
jgi:hypothetical protein